METKKLNQIITLGRSDSMPGVDGITIRCSDQDPADKISDAYEASEEEYERVFFQLAEKGMIELA